MQQVIVIGGGLAGLTAALELARARIPARIAVLEAGARLGGQIWTERDRGFVIERGGEGFVFRSAAVPELASAVGLGAELIGQSTLRSYGFGAEGLRALAPGEAATYLGFQVPAEDLGKGIRSLRGGMGSLIDALERALREHGVELALSAAVSGLERRGHQLVVRCAGSERGADAVVVATNARRAGELLEPLLAATHDAALCALRSAQTLSSVTVELAFERAGIEHPLDGTGFVVAAELQRDGVRACTFTSSKFEARAPKDQVSVRVFVRPEPGEIETLSDDAFTMRALQAFTRVVPVRSSPEASWVSRWPNALPVHSAAHTAAVAALDTALAPHAVWLAGAAFHGSGIDAAVRSGVRAGQQLAARLTTTHPAPP